MADKDFVVKNGLVVNNSFYANSSGIFIGSNGTPSSINSTFFSGLANVATYLGAANNTGNASGIYTNGVINAATISVGSFLANTSNVTIYGFYVNSTGAYTSNISTTNVSINATTIAVTNSTANVFIVNTTGVTSSLSLTTNTLTTTGLANLAGNANVSGNMYISGNLSIGGSFTYTGTGTASVIPGTNNSFSLGNSSFVWSNLYAFNAVFNSNLVIGNSSVYTTINSTSFTGTAANATQASNATNLNSQPGSYYLNYNNFNTGTVGAGYLPQANSSTNGAVIFLDSVSNTAVAIYAPTMNAVTTAYNAAIAANTRASSAQTAAAAAYTNATTFSSNATNITTGTIYPSVLPQANTTSNGSVIFLDSVTNTSVAIYAPTMNAVSTTYTAALAANTRATSAQTAASAAYTNATTFASNATNITTGTLPYAQLGANVVNTSAAFTITGVHTLSANVVLQAGLSANGGYGSNAQVLTSNGTVAYWANSSGGGATGNTAAGDAVFYVGGQTVNGDFTTNASLNYMSAGPITVNANVTITTGSRWAIV
jgi:hypothetical protein